MIDTPIPAIAAFEVAAWDQHGIALDTWHYVWPRGGGAVRANNMRCETHHTEQYRVEFRSGKGFDGGTKFGMYRPLAREATREANLGSTTPQELLRVNGPPSQ